MREYGVIDARFNVLLQRFRGENAEQEARQCADLWHHVYPLTKAEVHELEERGSNEWLTVSGQLVRNAIAKPQIGD